MTADDLSVLAKLADGASAAPWHICFTNDDACMSSVLILKNPTAGREYQVHDNDWSSEDVVAACLLQSPEIACVDDGRSHDNARLIAFSRNHLPELIRLASLGLAREQGESSASEQS